MRCSLPTPTRSAGTPVGVGAIVLFAAVGAATTAPGQSPTNPTPGQTPPPAKAGLTQQPPATSSATIDEIEKAGKAVQGGKIDEALKLLQDAVRKHPTLPPAKLMLARLLFNTRELHAQGRAYLEQAAAEQPDHPFVYLSNGDVALNEGRITDALLSCQRALELATAERWTPEQRKAYLSQAHKGLATVCEARRDWAGARTHLTAWLELEPRNGHIHQRLAGVLFFLDKPDDAYAELQKAIKDDPKLDPPMVTMGQLWTGKGDLRKARQWFERATQVEPNRLRVHLAYANWLLQQNEFDQAKAQADAAVKLKADDKEALKLQGLIARARKDLPAAEKIFRRVLTDTPGDFFASNHLALVLADEDDGDQHRRAMQLAEVNARQYPRSADALATYGYTLFRNGRVENALQTLQTAVSGGQATADTAYFLALALADRDKIDDARKLLEQALHTQGLFIYRKEAIGLLERLNRKAPAAPKK